MAAVLAAAALASGVFWAWEFIRVERAALLSLPEIQKILEEGDPVKASLYCRKRLRENPQDIPSHLLLGECHEASGDLPRAVKAYAAAVKIDPADPFARFYLGRALYGQGDVEQAVVELKEFQRLVPVNERAARAAASGLLVEIYMQFTKEYKKAVSELQTLAALEPANPEIGYQLGVAYAYSGQHQSAYREFQKILDEYPGTETARYAENAIQYVRERRSPERSTRVLAGR